MSLESHAESPLAFEINLQPNAVPPPVLGLQPGPGGLQASVSLLPMLRMVCVKLITTPIHA